MQVKLTNDGEIQFLDGDHLNRNSLNRKTLVVNPETALATRESLWVQFGDSQNFENVNANILEPIRLSEEEDGYKTIFPDEVVKNAGTWYMTLAVRMYSTDGTTFSEQLTSDKVSFAVNDSYPMDDDGYRMPKIQQAMQSRRRQQRRQRSKQRKRRKLRQKPRKKRQRQRRTTPRHRKRRRRGMRTRRRTVRETRQLRRVSRRALQNRRQVRQRLRGNRQARRQAAQRRRRRAQVLQQGARSPRRIRQTERRRSWTESVPCISLSGQFRMRNYPQRLRKRKGDMSIISPTVLRLMRGLSRVRGNRIPQARMWQWC